MRDIRQAVGTRAGRHLQTAWRMFNKIRSLLAQDDEMFGGTVEFDEAFVGDSAQWRSPARSRALGGSVSRAYSTKTPVSGLAQRGQNGKHGKVRALVADRKLRAEDFVGHETRCFLVRPSTRTTQVSIGTLSRWVTGTLVSPTHQRCSKRRRSQEHHRGLLGVAERRDRRRLPPGFDQAPTVLPGRIRVPLQPPRP
jgi:hypothetical protein